LAAVAPPNNAFRRAAKGTLPTSAPTHGGTCGAVGVFWLAGEARGLIVGSRTVSGQ
jgi:hypothetical protein